MERPLVERRLATILAADLVGYSRLMNADETGTFTSLRSLRTSLISPSISAYKGRLIKTMGDGFLAEFPSVVNAVNCALELQQEIEARAEDVSPERQFRLRIGVNLGDVLVDGDDLIGEGVNVASRLEGLAQPGTVAVSESVKIQLDGRIEAKFEDQGEHQLKNIQQPVRIWLVRPVVATKTSLNDLAVSREPAQSLSIAVLPFVNMSGEGGQDYFVDGLTEDIITDLSNVPGFFVIARNSTFAYKGKSVDVRTIARELGVKYVLEGSARRAADRLRINAQLIDAAGRGNHIWAERFDKNVVDIFEVQDQVTRHVVDAISSHLRIGPTSVASARHPRSLQAYELCLRARNLFSESRQSNLEAEELLTEALRLDPGYAEAHWQLAMVRAFKWLQWGFPQEPSRPLSLLSAQAALDSDPQDSNAHWVMGYVLLNERRWEEARAHYATAIRLNPNNAEALAPYANFSVYMGETARAVELARMMVRVNPHAPWWCNWALGFALVAHGEYAEAVRVLREPNIYRTVARRILAAALALSGEQQQAEREARLFLSMYPDWRISTWIESQPFRFEKDREFWIRSYRLANFPD